MSSKFQDIDDFIRNKENEISLDSKEADKNWQEMQKTLQPTFISNKTNYQKLILRFAAAIIPPIIVIAILLNTKAKRSKEHTIDPITVNVPQTTTIEIPQDTSKPFANSNTHKKNGQAVAIKPIISFPTTQAIDSSDIELTATTPVVTDKEAFDMFYRSIEKRAEEFTIFANKDTTIYCKEGSIIFIPANCFETEKGETVKESVKISVKEFYNISDIVGNKLSTFSDNRMLETGGMLHISAKTNSQIVRIRQGSALDLKMPTRIFDPEMKLFMGEQVSANFAATNIATESNDTSTNRWMAPGAINWMDRGQQQMFIKESRKIITLLNMRDNPVSTNYYKRNTKTKGVFIIPYNSTMSTAEVKKQLEEKYGKWYDKIVVRREGKGLFRSAKKEKAEGIPQNEWYESPYVADSITIPIQYAVRLKYITREDSIAYENKWRDELIAKQKRQAAYKEYLEFRQSYNFKIENLGWINCDQFLDYPSSRLTEFVINVGEGFENGFFTSMLIFKKRAVALPGYYRDKKIHFARIPVGEEVSIVSTTAKDGKMHASIIQSATVRKQTTPELKFAPITPEDFKQRLSLLGNVTTARN